MGEYCTCFNFFYACICFNFLCVLFLFLYVYPCLSEEHSSFTAKEHNSKESPSPSSSQNGTTTIFYTNIRTQPQRETLDNWTTPQQKTTTLLASTITTTNQETDGAKRQEASSTTSSQETAEMKPSKSTTKQQNTAGRSQSNIALMQFVVHGCVKKQWLH